jgi:hypothetical protein
LSKSYGLEKTRGRSDASGIKYQFIAWEPVPTFTRKRHTWPTEECYEDVEGNSSEDSQDIRLSGAQALETAISRLETRRTDCKIRLTDHNKNWIMCYLWRKPEE